MDDRPTAGFVLVLIAGIIGLIWSAIWLSIAAMGSALLNQIRQMSMSMNLQTSNVGSMALSILIGIFAWWLIAAIILIFSSFLIYSGEPSKVKTGGILAIIFSILSLGNIAILVLILGIIGGALAYSWAKRRLQRPVPPPEKREYIAGSSEGVGEEGGGSPEEPQNP